MNMKPIAMAAISGLVIALAGMQAWAEDSDVATDASAGQLMQGGASSSDQSATDSSPSSTDSTQSQSTNAGSSDTATSNNNTDEGNPDTPTGDDY